MQLKRRTRFEMSRPDAATPAAWPAASLNHWAQEAMLSAV